MTFAKKALALLLSACLLASIFTAMGAVSVSAAEEGVANLDFVYDDSPVYEFTCGEWREDNGENFFEYYIPANDSSKIVLTYEDETTREFYHTWNEDERRQEYWSADGHSLIEGEDFWFQNNQWDEHWGIGEHKFYVIFGEDETAYEFPMEIVKNPVESIKFTPKNHLTLYKGLSGRTETDGNGEEFFRYDTRWFEEGDKLTVTYNDDRGECEYVFNRNSDGEFFMSEDDCIDAHNVNYDDNQFQTHWTAVGDYDISVEYLNKSDSFTVSVIETPVKSVNYTCARGDIVYYENFNGDWRISNDGENFFEYWFPMDDGDVLSVTYKDEQKGTVDYRCSWNEQERRHVFTSADGETLLEDIDVRVDHNQYEEPWGLGQHSFTVSCCGISKNIPATVCETPVESIEYRHQREVTYYENSDGDFMTDDNGEEYFEYNIPVFDGDVLTVKYKDQNKGTVDYVCSWDDKMRTHVFTSASGEKLYERNEINFNNYQRELHWTVGGENVYEIACLGFSTSLSVPIVVNPVESISFEPANDLVLYEGLSGNTDIDDNGNEYFRYDTRWFEEGDKLTVTYNDDRGECEYVFNRNSDGEFFMNEEDCIDAHNVEYNDRQWDNHWDGEGEYDITVGYCGKTTSFTATVTQTPVESVKYVLSSPVEYYLNTEGEIREDDNGDEYFEYWLPINDGSVLKVTYNDDRGTVDYVCRWDEVNRRHKFVSRDGATLTEGVDVFFDDDQRDNHWFEGEHSFNLIVMGVSGKTSLNIVLNPVNGIEFVADRILTLYKELSGEWRKDDNGNDFFEYDVRWFEDGDGLIVSYNDERGEVYYSFVRNEDSELFVSEDGDVIDAHNVSFDSRQFDNHWNSEGEHDIEIRYAGFTSTFTALVVESPVKSIQYIPSGSTVLYKNFSENGSWRVAENGDNFFEYSFPFSQGDILRVTYNDQDKGTVDYVGRFDEEIEETLFESADGEIINSRYDIDVEHDQYREPWGLGEHSFGVVYCGVTANVGVEVIDNPVKSISVTVPEPISYNEERNGEWLTGEHGDSYFHYYVNLSDGTKVTVTYTDDTTEDYVLTSFADEDEQCFVNSNGDRLGFDMIHVNSRQFSNHWSVGTDNYIYISYLGFEATIPVTINTIQTAGRTGDCAWLFDSENGATLTISGNGAMADYSASNPAPWSVFEISKVIIEDGVTSIGNDAFLSCAVGEIEIADSVTSIGVNAFNSCTIAEITLPESLKTVGACAFESTRIMSVVIPRSVETIGDLAFGFYFDKQTNEDSHIKDFVIRGYAGTAAQTYANDNHLNFEPIQEPTTAEPTTEVPMTEPITVAPVTAVPATEPVTEAPTTEAQTTEPVTEAPTTEAPTTEPTTVAPTTEAPTTEPATEAPTTEAPATEPATVAPTTSAPKPSLTVKTNSLSIVYQKVSKIKFQFKNGAGKPTFKSMNTNIATVDSNGSVKAIRAGSTTVKVTYCGITKSVSINVKKANNTGTLEFKKKITASRSKNVTFKKLIKLNDAQGKVKYTLKVAKKYAAKIKLNGTKLTVKKGLPKGKIKLKITVTAKGNANYKSYKKAVEISLKIQ